MRCSTGTSRASNSRNASLVSVPARVNGDFVAAEHSPSSSSAALSGIGLLSRKSAALRGVQQQLDSGKALEIGVVPGPMRRGAERGCHVGGDRDAAAAAAGAKGSGGRVIAAQLHERRAA